MIRFVCIGLGYRGKYLLKLLSKISDFELVGIADPAIEETLETLPKVNIYTDPVVMLKKCKADLAVVATPWQFHIELAEACIKNGYNVALEIRGGGKKGEYDNLIELQRKTGLKIFPLENVLFDRKISSVRQMVHEGLFGEIVYMRGGYRHDIRKVLLGDGAEAKWRTPLYYSRNADIYPTHGFAPLCSIAGIKHITHLHSLASKSLGLERLNPNIKPQLGDIVSTQLLSPEGILINLIHDTTLPRPKSLDFEVQGTKGIWNGDRKTIFFEGMKNWEPDAPYIDKYEDYYWTKYGKEAIKADPHHSGMDFIMLKAIEEDLNGLRPYPADINDLALWTSVTYLSEDSIQNE